LLYWGAPLRGHPNNNSPAPTAGSFFACYYAKKLFLFLFFKNYQPSTITLQQTG
jgi:hypothetical protein